MAVREINWEYTARNNNGELSMGHVMAATAVIARVKIRKLGLEPVEVKKKDAFWSLGALGKKKPKEDNDVKNLTTFSEELRPEDIHTLVSVQGANKENKKKA